MFWVPIGYAGLFYSYFILLVIRKFQLFSKAKHPRNLIFVNSLKSLKAGGTEKNWPILL